jgi:hypothetical protein
MRSENSENISRKSNLCMSPLLKGSEGELLNEKGIALVMVMILSVIALAIMAALLYMLTSSTQISGMQKRYKTAFEASVGGSDVIYQMLSSRGNPNIPGITDTAAFFSTAFTSPCMIAKLNSSTSTTNWAACGTGTDYILSTSISIDPTDPKTYDTKFQLGTAPLQYTVYSKIVNTVEGNSGGEAGLIKSGVISSNSGEVAVVSVPYLYSIEISAENTTTPAERAKLSVLYQY